MLQRLSIQNFAIIHSLEVQFSNGYSVITGETGAGKSILLGALDLVLGSRADTSVLLQPDKKCVVEAAFTAGSYPDVQAWLQEQLGETDSEVILRREISGGGRSRAFVNDTPVQLQQLRTLAALLIDLHQQFDTLELSHAAFQRRVIDTLANQQEAVGAYHQQFQQWMKYSRQLEELEQQQQQQAREKEFKQFLLDELQEASFSNNELEQLEQEQQLHTNAGAVVAAVSAASWQLQEGDQNIIQQLKQVVHRLEQYQQLLPALQPLLQRLQSTHIELSDVAAELGDLQERVTVDEERLQIINDRMELGYKLCKKHQVRTTAELLAVQQQLEAELATTQQTSNTIAQLQQQVQQLQQQLQQAAQVIHQARKKAATPFDQQVRKLLERVGMPNALIKTMVEQGGLNAYGNDTITFLFDANKSGRFEPIDKVASGGELSRLMLCIKSLIAARAALPTMIFDEIDSGISGEAAKQVGLLLQELAGKHQVITITHLPQIAAKAKAHYFVYKQQQTDGIHTSIRLLNKDEQVEAVARMLSGDQMSEASLNTAREMVHG